MEVLVVGPHHHIKVNTCFSFHVFYFFVFFTRGFNFDFVHKKLNKQKVSFKEIIIKKTSMLLLLLCLCALIFFFSISQLIQHNLDTIKQTSEVLIQNYTTSETIIITI